MAWHRQMRQLAWGGQKRSHSFLLNACRLELADAAGANWFTGQSNQDSRSSYDSWSLQKAGEAKNIESFEIWSPYF